MQGSNEPSQLIFFTTEDPKNEEGEIVEAEFAVDLIRTLTDWNILWEVTVISEKFYEDRFVVIFDPNIEQVNGDPDKGDTWL